MPADFDGTLKLVRELKDKKLAPAALEKLTALVGDKPVEGVLVQAIPAMMDAVGDKDKKVQQGATACIQKIVETIPDWAAAQALPLLASGMQGSVKPAQKVVALTNTTVLCKRCPKQVKEAVVEILPVITGLVWDVKADVQTAAADALDAVCRCSGNSDLDGFIPAVISALKTPASLPDGVESLAGCVFVQEVEAPAIAVLLPVLIRGLNHERTDVKRKCCVVIDNMCKLVEHPREVLPLIPGVLPLLDKLKDAISDPEARAMAEKAGDQVKKVTGDGAEQRLKTETVLSIVKAACSDVSAETVTYGTGLCAALARADNFDASEWSTTLSPLKEVLKGEYDAAVAEVLKKVLTAANPAEVQWDEVGEGELCRAEFGLAYGARTLLTKTRLQLQRNKFYGLLGPNNCGKTTLMRAIAAEQVDGFPKRDVLLSIFVEHEIPEREVDEDKDGFPILNIDLKGIDWVVDMCNNIYGCDPKVTREQVTEVMVGIGFGNSEAGSGKDRAADAAMGVWTYSGGWKMKMQLCAAQLVKADLLMLDEPTGHLDVTNIAWLRGWLTNFMEGGGSVIATSHDTEFLNIMCDALVDFEERKLRTFKDGEKGNVLTEFVTRFPEKQGYFVLKNDVTKFNFPVPGPLAGVKSKSRHLVKMKNVTFQYPTRDTPTVFDINLEASRISRVAVIGANGAGKSTAIKLLTGELIPTKGEVERHPNLRMAYVAQHAFQHLEKHLTQTPVQYILERFAGSDDKEAIDFKAEVVVTEKKKYFLNAQNELKPCEEQKDMAKAIDPEAILDRRENKKEKTKEYQTKLMNKSVEDAIWIPRAILEKMGMLAKVQREDEKQAMMAGLQQKALTSEGVEKHLVDFGLEVEAASHTTVQSLSGGQKVKVVLAASMWLNPHILILDEPTNYLDRDGLGALTLAIRDFEGGVIIISHNREFCGAVAEEKWIMKGGQLRQEGESKGTGEDDKKDTLPMEKEVKTDAMGNVIAEKESDMDPKKRKKEIKAIEKQLKDNKKKGTLSQEEVWELEDKLAKLKETDA